MIPARSPLVQLKGGCRPFLSPGTLPVHVMNRIFSPTMQFGGTIYVFFRLHPSPPFPAALQLQEPYIDNRDHMFAFNLKFYVMVAFSQPSMKI